MAEQFKTKKIAVMLYSLRFGGAERVMLTLSEQFIKMGIEVDLIVFEPEGEFSSSVPEGVNIINLAHIGAFDAAREMTHYIKRETPDAIIASGDRCTLTAYLARKKTSRKNLKIITVIHTDLAGAAENAHSSHGRFSAAFKKIPMTFIYPKIERIVAVSSVIGDSAARFLNYPREKIRTIYDPIDVEQIKTLAEEETSHPWFASDRAKPVIVSVGRLTAQKDFLTLVRAFTILRDKTPARLAIIGEGYAREYIENLVSDLGIEDDVMLMGFQRNPHKFVARADLFALASVYEGFAHSIVDAVALGTPAVATDCPSGPAEILGRKGGLLAPPGDPEALAKVMADRLAKGRNDLRRLPSWVKTPHEAALKYIELIESND